MPIDRYFIDSDKITPIAGIWTGRPKPKKVIAASCKIAWGNNRISPTANWIICLLQPLLKYQIKHIPTILTGGIKTNEVPWPID